MKFDTPAKANPIDRMKVVGKPIDRVDGPLKTTGRATYAYEQNDAASAAAYGYIIGAAIARGRIRSMDLAAARRAPGVIAIVTADSAGKLGKDDKNTAHLLGGPQVEHYHQAIALVVADSFEQARAAAGLVRVDYARDEGSFDLEKARASAKAPESLEGEPADTNVGDFAAAFAAAPVTIDAEYATPDHSHAMMEPHATIAAWQGDELTLWTSNQMIDWGRTGVAKTLGIAPEKVHLRSPYIGGGFGSKLFTRADAVLAALGARAAKRPVKVMLQRALIANNTTHRPATLQRIRIGADKDGKITAIGHENWSGDLPDGGPDTSVIQTRALYAGANRMTATRLAVLHLPESNAMRAPGEATGHMALEIAMDEMAEKLGLDPVEFRIRNDTPTVPDDGTGAPNTKPFSQRELVACLKTGADRFGWDKRARAPGTRRDGQWLIGMGVASAYRGAPVQDSAARVRLDPRGIVTVETDMTDIGTGSYTIIAQTAAEMLGTSVEKVVVKLGDTAFPVSSGSGGQWGAASSTAGVYAACLKLRETIAGKHGLVGEVEFADGRVRAGNRNLSLAEAAGPSGITVEDGIEFGDLSKRFQQASFGAHFVEVAVDADTAEVRLRRMLAVCAAGRILNPKTARSQVIGAMTMGAGAALMEELAVDKRFGFFANHDLAGYEVPVHADIPHQDVIFIDGLDPTTSPMKANGVGELGICGVAAAVANAVHNATGIRVRQYPITLDKLIGQMPAIA